MTLKKLFGKDSFFMERWYMATKNRFSVRKYKKGLSDDEMKSLQGFADTISCHGVRIVLAKHDKVLFSRTFGNGIHGTNCFAAVVYSKSGSNKAFSSDCSADDFLLGNASLSVGYIGELFLLECVARGFGTCFVGSSFRMTTAVETLNLSEAEKLACVIAIGYCAETYAPTTRRPITMLTHLSVSDFLKLEKWQQCAIECARRAPSAVNAQPWEFKVEQSGEITVFRTSGNMGFGKTDCGIAMLHIELGAAHEGVFGHWITSGRGGTFVPYEITLNNQIESTEEEEPVQHDADGFFDYVL